MKKTAFFLLFILMACFTWSQENTTLEDIRQIKTEIETKRKLIKAVKPKEYKNNSRKFKFTYFDNENSNLPTTLCNTLAVDKDDVIWVGTEHGIARVDSDFVTAIDTLTIDSLSNLNLSIQNITIDSHNNKWFLINNSIVAKFDNKNWTSYNSKNSPLGVVNQIFADNNENVWFCTNIGVLIFHDNTWTLINTSNSILPDNQVEGGYVDTKNRIWIGTKAGSIMINGNDTISFQNSQTPMKNCTIRKGLEDKDGNIWFATTSIAQLGYFTFLKSNGLVKLGTNNNWSNLNIENSDIPGNTVISFAGDKNSGNIWLSINYDGLTKYKNNEWEVYTPFNSNLSCNTINDIAIDKSGAVWCASRCGLLKIKQKQAKK